MPIYEFHCKECRQEFRTLRAHQELDSVVCPTCGTGKVARLLSVTAQHPSPSAGEGCALPMRGG
jgi:putative FmdB family regulatory protein